MTGDITANAAASAASLLLMLSPSTKPSTITSYNHALPSTTSPWYHDEQKKRARETTRNQRTQEQTENNRKEQKRTMNTWNDIERGFGPARATQYTVSRRGPSRPPPSTSSSTAATSDATTATSSLSSDGTHLTITLGDGDTAGVTSHTTSANDDNQDTLTQPRAKADRRIIERAHLHANVSHAGTITSLALVLFYQGETMPATIRAGHADITTGTFATPRDRSKPLATIRVALTQSQVNEWVKREQQALADMLVGETIVAAGCGVLTLTGGTLAGEGTGALADAVANENQSDSTGAGEGEDNNIVTIHATLNNHKRDNNGPVGGHATTITPRKNARPHHARVGHPHSRPRHPRTTRTRRHSPIHDRTR